MRWNHVNDKLPPRAKRVLVRCADGWWQVGKLVLHDGKPLWISDISIPIHGVIEWLDPVAEDEIV